ncbi:MAG: HAMP domain-containing protein [Planctomycetaceae bacterium]|jgi:signal transduction histidine kinase|nr:HAMP domain-containing protein [Planctomycetaceae bacterium]
MKQQIPAKSRAMFESSLELKCLFFFGIALSMVITMSFWLYWCVTETLVSNQNLLTAESLGRQYLMFEHVKQFTKEQHSLPPGAMVLPKPPSEITVPLSPSVSPPPVSVPEPVVIPPQVKQDEDFQDSLGEIMGEKLAGQKGPPITVIRSPLFASEIPEQKSPRNAEEEALLKRFERQPPPESHEKPYYEIQTDMEGQYHYYKPFWAQNHCLSCHNINSSDMLTPGDLIGIIHITISDPPAKKAISDYWAWLLVAAIVTAVLSMLAFYVVIRWIIIKPLRHLRDVSEAISRGETTQRADLHTGDEFEGLALAFNRTLRQILNTQEKLRGVNKELDQRVEQLANTNMQLYEMNRVKSDFMATMSHELRTPLNSILGFSDVLGAISSLDEKQKRYVENINKSGKSLLNMINDILDMAKIESGQITIQLQDFSIGHIVAVQCDMAKPLVDKKNISLEYDLPDGLPLMHQDPSRLQQILNNLLSNAIKFTPEAGRIKVQIRRLPPGSPKSYLLAATGPVLEMKVIDNGVGITEEDQQIIFEKFRQGKSSTPEGDTMKREHSGSGLGLSIVKELCRLMEGSVTVESQFGLGSTFTVLLPWILEPQTRIESEMMLELQQFSKTKPHRLPDSL